MVRFLAVRWLDDLEVQYGEWESLGLGAACVGALVLACGLRGQSSANAGSYVPLPQPGYGLFFQDSAGAPNVASRWGYNDGWEDGRHDRNHGETAKVEEKSDLRCRPNMGCTQG